MKRISIFCLLLLLSSNLIQAKSINVRLEKVIDGDTIYFFTDSRETIRCRVAYVDTPEKNLNKKAKRDLSKCFDVKSVDMILAGKNATKFAKDYFSNKKFYNINIIDTDRYGRSVCEIEDFNKEIVVNGYAIAYNKYIPEKLKKTYEDYQKIASMSLKGNWNNYSDVMTCLSK